MTSRVSSIDGIEPSVREKAEAAARRAGMSLAEWMNSMAAGAGPDVREAREVAEIHTRLDTIARQVEKISPQRPSERGDPGVARQLNDAISRLDARLSQISAPPASPPTYGHAPQPAYAPAPPLSPDAMDFSLDEIMARQDELDGRAPRQPPARAPNPASAAAFGPSPFMMPAYGTPPTAPQSPYGEFSGLEQRLSNQMETLRRPVGIEHSVAEFRSELSEIRRAITEAMPRRAIESLEGEIRSLGRRIDENRQNGTDSNALSGIENALSDIRGALRSLTPAEQLAGFDDAIRNLGGKIDSIVRASHDPGAMHQLEAAIAAMKAIVANVASNDALGQLADNVQALSSKVDQLAYSGGSEIFAALETRIAALTSTLESRDRGGGDSSYFDNAVQSISDRLDHLRVGNDSSSTFAHVEQRVHQLLERLETSGSRDGNLSRVEEALSDILHRLESQRASGPASGHASAADGELADSIKRELSDMRFSQLETDRHTQDSLEIVHSTLGHVVDRLAQIEGDLRGPRSAPAATSHHVSREAPMPAAREVQAPTAPVYRPELPNPAAIQSPPVARNAPATAPAAAASPEVAPPSFKDVQISSSYSEEAAARTAGAPPSQQRAPIDPSLPPDHPLEPGTRMQSGGSSPSERIAASQVVLNGLPSGAHEPASSSNFIQAARRAAQAAAAASVEPATAVPANKKPNRVTASSDAAKASKPKTAAPSKLTSKIRAVLVGASVVVIVLGTVKFAMNVLGGDPSAPAPATESNVAPPPPIVETPKTKPPAPGVPSITSPAPIGRQSLNVPPPAPLITARPLAPDMTATGAIPAAVPIETPRAPVAAAPQKPALPFVAINDKLPDGIGGPILRAAALKGDPTAAFEVGVRFAEGKGVAADYAEAAKWYDRASQRDVIPATFRLGTLYEKGLGVDKNTETARRLYVQAAERGSAKAMHNLAVLDADGGSKGPNYKGAAQWFRKAAETGIADSQFNLGVLYARGIGVEQNLAESFKWFTLAAAQGDADAARKRDDIAKRLDATSLAAAKLSIQTFRLERQPDDAANVAVPAGGWDNAPVQKTTAKPPKNKTVAR